MGNRDRQNTREGGDHLLAVWQERKPVQYMWSCLQVSGNTRAFLPKNPVPRIR